MVKKINLSILLMFSICFINIANIYASSEDKEYCEKNRNYYNSDSSKAEIGCYEMDEANCNIFGFYWNGETCDTSITEFNILFDQNYGYGLECTTETHYKDTNAGICSGTVKPNTIINYPKASSSMIRYDKELLMGWSENPECFKGTINNYNDNYTVSKNTNFYACFRENISGYRFIQEDAVADGGEPVPCGTKYWIEYCTKESDGDFCYYIEPGTTDNYRKLNRHRIAETEKGALNTCTTETTTPEELGYRYITTDGSKYSCGNELYITTCDEDTCNYTKIKSGSTEINENGTVDRSLLSDDKKATQNQCDESNKCVNKKILKRKNTSQYTICYSKGASISSIKNNLEKYYVCDTLRDYYFDKTLVKAENEEKCNGDSCKRTYTVSCKLGDGEGNALKPNLEVQPGMVQNNGKGTIRVKASSTAGDIVKYYTNEIYKTPTFSSSGWQNVDSDNFEISKTPGTIYIWVMDSKGNISNGVSGSVLDTSTSSTTIKTLSFHDANGNVQTPTKVASSTDIIKSNKYVLMSNDLKDDSSVLADAFNPFDMEYKLTVESPTITVYATLTSTDSKYVDGYEPRTVNLDYGINTILIKIENNEGKVRTYTILVTRADDRTSDNTLKELNVNIGKLEFNTNVTDYKVEIPSDTTNVKVDAIITSDKASFINGYEPGNVEIKKDTTVKVIKVSSQTGSTRTYVITFIKKGKDIISKESLQLEDLVIPGSYISFEKEVANYSLSVNYESESIDIYPTLKDSNSKYIIYSKKKTDAEYKAVSNIGLALDVGENYIEIRIENNKAEKSIYRLTIIRKEFGLEISNNSELKELNVLDYDIKFEPNKYEYEVRIKQEKSLVITAVPNNNRAEVFIRGNEELTGFSTVRVKVVAENGEFKTYSIDIKKDAFNKTIEIASIIAGVVIIIISSSIIIIKKKTRAKKEYYEE